MIDQRVSIIRISGIDAAYFLQKNITNNIDVSDNLYSLILNPLGKYNFDFFLSRYNGDFIIELPFQSKQDFITKLNRIKLRSQLVIEDISHIYHFRYSRHYMKNALISYQDPRYNKLGYRNIITTEKDRDENITEYLSDKYKFAIPDSLDLIVDKSFPLEYGLDKLNALNFSKGCYTGQEVISRTRTRGEIRKKIYKLVSKTNIEKLDKKYLIKDEKKLLYITSVYGQEAIALVRSDFINCQKLFDFNNYQLMLHNTIWNSNQTEVECNY